MPQTNPPCHPTVFTDRFWDTLDGWEPLGVGLVPGSMRPYFGQLPPTEFGHMVGTPDQFAHGLLYSVYQAGGYPPPCGIAVIAYLPRDRGALVWGGGDLVAWVPDAPGDGAGIAFNAGDAVGYLVPEGDGGGDLLDAGDQVLYLVPEADQGGELLDAGDQVLYLVPEADGGGIACNAGDAVGYTVPADDLGGELLDAEDLVGYTVPVDDGGGELLDAGDAVTYSGGPPTPGATCLTATAISLGTSYTADTSTAHDTWWVYTVVGGHSYTFTWVLNSGSNFSILFQQGTCSALTFVAASFAPGTITVTPGSSGNLWMHVSQTGAVDNYTFSLT